MEALAALSLAGNVIQFIEFGSKLFSQGCELYKSTDGRLAVDDELRLITIELKEFINKIQGAGITDQPNTSETTLSITGATPDSNLENICCEATKIAKAILSKLTHRKLDKGRNRKLESFKRVWSQIWSQGELDSLYGRLSRLREAIDSGTLAAILRNTNELNVQTLAHVQKSDHEVQLILKSVLESSRVSNRVMSAVAQLASRIEMFNPKNKCDTRARIMQKRGSDPGMLLLDDKTRFDEVFTLSQWEEEELRGFVNNGILRNLTYEMLHRRYEAVAEAHPKTFGWALQDSSSSELSSEKLATWLQSDFGLYWISGKPGSGKSTLMKHILDDERTKEYLEQWVRQDGDSNARLIVASFFFWNSGALEQRSQMGMLRSLLFQVLEQEPELLPIVLPLLWLKQYREYLTVGPGAVWSEAWTLSMLMTAFKRLTAQQEIPCKLFFLVDGLDEFEGDQELLAELFNDISKSRLPNTKISVKLCVSSRPYVVFQENFQGYPMLKLQELTVQDITRFVSDRFLGNGAFKKLAAREPQATTQLIDAVVSKADGVFLWVFIVVKDLLKGIRNRDTIPELWRRLDALPGELEPLYLRIMSQIDPVYLTWASKTFQLIRAAREVLVPEGSSLVHQDFLTIAELYFALNEDLDSSAVKQMTQMELDIICRETEYHIAARCACLLEVTNEPKMSEGEVQYLHRTARDFLEEPSRWATIVQHTKSIVFDPYWSMLRSKSFSIKRLLILEDEEEIFAARAISNIMPVLAMKIDSHSPFCNDRMSVLDNVEDMMDEYDWPFTNGVNSDMWFAGEAETSLSRRMQSSLLACALTFHFTEYVVRRVSALTAQDPTAGKLAATAMLRYHTINDWLLTEDSAVYQPPHIELATALAQQGADLNLVIELKSLGITIWQTLLHCPARFDPSRQQKVIDLGFPRLMSTALAFGADPNAQPLGSASLIDYVESYIRPVYPADADRLRNDVIKAEAIVRGGQVVSMKAKINGWWQAIFW